MKPGSEEPSDFGCGISDTWTSSPGKHTVIIPTEQPKPQFDFMWICGILWENSSLAVAVSSIKDRKVPEIT